MVDALHASEIPPLGALIKVVQCESDKRKNVVATATASAALTPRKRASTLGVISELPNNQDKGGSGSVIKSPPAHCMQMGPQRPRLSSATSSSNTSLNGDSLPVIAGHVKNFGEQVERGTFKIEDRVVVHPKDPSPSTCYLRDTEFRTVSDVAYLVTIPSAIPMKLAAMLGGRGLSFYSSVLQTKNYIFESLANNNKNKESLFKILVITNDEFSMMTVQLLNHFLNTTNNQDLKILLALAALKDDGMMWYKKNMPGVKLIQWNGDAYDQDLVERTRDACKGEVDIVIGCLGLGAPLQRSFKCLKKGGIAFVTDDVNEKVLKSLMKLAEQQNRSLIKIERGSSSVSDLQDLLELVVTKQIQPAFLQDDQDLEAQVKVNPVEQRRKARSMSSRTPTTRTVPE